MKATLPSHEAERLKALREYDVLDSGAEQKFDDLTHLAAQICGTPISALTLLDGERQWFKSRVGLTISQTPRVASFCARTILEDDILLVADVAADERFADNPLVKADPHIRFYAGVPLLTPEGYAVGSLCVIDTVPRQLDQNQQDALRRLARQAVALLEARTDVASAQSQQTRQRTEPQSFLHCAMDALTTHIAVLDETGTIIAANEAWQQFAEENGGTAIACGVGANYIEVCEQAQGAWTEQASALAHGIREAIGAPRQAFCLEYPCHSPSEERWFSVCVTRFTGVGPVRVVVAHENITARKLAEMALKLNETKFRTIFETTLDAILLANDNGHYVDANPAACALLGVEHQQLMGRSVLDFVSLDTREAVGAAWEELLREGQQSGEFEFQQPNGSQRRAEFRAVAALLPGVHMAVMRDITERKRAEQELRDSEARFQNIVTNVPGMIYQFVKHADNSIEWPFIGQGFQEIFEEEPQILDNNPCWPMDQVHPDERGDFNRSVLVSEEMLRPRNWEGRLRLASGKIKWIQITSHPHRLPDGVTLWNGLVMDITARKEAEVERDRFFTLSLDMLAIIGSNGYIKRLNPAFEATLGFSNAELMSVPFLEFVHPDDHAATLQAMAKLDSGLQLMRFENRYRCRDGSYKWLQWMCAPFGNLWYCVAHDITGVKQNAAALIEGEERFRQMAESVDEVFWLFDPVQEKLLYVSPAYEKVWGRSCQSLLDAPLSFNDTIHPQDRARVLAALEAQVRPNGYNLEHRIVRPDGTSLWIWARTFPIYNEKGEVYRIAGIAQDISERKKAEAALQKANDELELHVRERTAELSLTNDHLQLEMIERRRTDELLYKNHEFLEAVLENTAEGIVACDAEGQLTFFNHATRELHGLPLEELPADQWSEFYSLYFPDGITPMQKEDVPLFRALNGNPVRDMEMVIATKNGRARFIIVNGEPLFGADGTKLGAVAVMHDITERKQAEVELQRAKQEADTANLAKSEFLSRMSHELRTPLNAILGFGQVLEREKLTPFSKEAVGYILKGGRHLLGLINEVLDIARVEAGRDDLSLEPVVLSEVISEACSLVRPLAAERNIALDQNFSMPASTHVLCDRQRLRQVLINLLSNAIKYNRLNGQVVVSCKLTPDNRIGIAVRDTGLGIAPEDLSKLFTPFERLSATNSDVEGTGLGLVLSQRLVTAMGGAMEMQSSVGQGSIFSFELPQAPSLPEKSGDITAHGLESDTTELTKQQYLVLCIEDNTSNLRLLEIVLVGRPEITLLSAMQGSVGLDLARQHKPDLILLDLHLPDIPGQEVLERLQRSAITRDIPVIIISADATEAQSQRLTDAGAEAYLTKPLNIAEFLHLLDEVLLRQETS